MTRPHKTRLTRLREGHPEWDIWRAGKRWWAKPKQSATTIDADTLGALAQRLSERGESVPAVIE